MKLTFSCDKQFLNLYSSVMEAMKEGNDINYDIISVTPNAGEGKNVTGLIELSNTDYMTGRNINENEYEIQIPVHSEHYGVYKTITYKYNGGHEKIYLYYKENNAVYGERIEGCSSQQNLEPHNLAFELLEKTYKLTGLILPPDILEELKEYFFDNICQLYCHM